MPQASLRCDSTCTATVVTAAASAEDGPGAASAARRIAASSSRDTSAISSEISSALEEVAVDGAGRDIGADRDRSDLHRHHAAFGRSVPGRRQDGATPRRQPLYDLMGSPIDHGASSVPSAPSSPVEPARTRAPSTS